MKKIKFLLALVIALSLVSMCAMANNEYIRFVDDEYEYAGEPVVIGVYTTTGYEAAGNVSFSINFDPTIWEITDYTLKGTGDAGVVGANINYSMSGANLTCAAGSNIIEFTATLKEGQTAAGSTFKINTVDMCAGNWDEWVFEEGTLDTITIVDKVSDGGAPETPVSVATTMTVGETEYTDVPNATVTDVAFSEGVITGALTIDYWKGGAAQPAKVIEATKFAGMPANVTGSGTASFTVALMGVPTDVTITGISFK